MPQAPKKLAPCIMVLGTTSDAGKSWVATAICRYLANLGYKVAPFKAQNMSNNARVVPGARGCFGEIGSAQYFQALAAKTPANTLMNPVLLKPESDCSSQVVVMGKVDPVLSATPWRDRSSQLWPHIQSALCTLREQFDVVVIEGAGSPAEINLRAKDIVNMSVAHEANAHCLLVCDIDRGGAFAHLFGTWALLDKKDRSRIDAFILNKFRGDPTLLAPGPEMLYERTGVPIAGVIPMIKEHRLPEEDGQSAPAFVPLNLDSTTTDLHKNGPCPQTPRRRPRIVAISYPHISNLDEFSALSELKGHQFFWTQDPAVVRCADLLILPGSKHTVADLAWMRAQGLHEAISDLNQRGKAILGICGGLQMLGQRIVGSDLGPAQAQAQAQATMVQGLGLLGVETRFEGEKTLRPTHAKLPAVHQGPWQSLSHQSLSGYEIHVGDTVQSRDIPVTELIPQLAWLNERSNVLGLYAHGIFEDDQILKALFNEAHSPLESSFEALADAIAKTQIPDLLRPWLPVPPSA